MQKNRSSSYQDSASIFHGLNEILIRWWKRGGVRTLREAWPSRFSVMAFQTGTVRSVLVGEQTDRAPPDALPITIAQF
jgi:hypothetical protein